MGTASAINYPVVFAAGFISFLAYAIGLITYRLYFSPISKSVWLQYPQLVAVLV